MSELLESSDDEVEWEQKKDVKEVSEETLKEFSKEFQVKKNDNLLLKNQLQEIIAQYQKENADKKSLTSDLKSLTKEYHQVCFSSDEVNQIVNSRSPKNKVNPNEGLETKEQIAELNALSKEIELSQGRLEAKKKSLMNEKELWNTELNRLQANWESITKQNDILKSQISIFTSNESNDFDDEYEYEEDEDENENKHEKEKGENDELKMKAEKGRERNNKTEQIKEQDTDKPLARKSCDLFPAPKPFSTKEIKSFEKCDDPDMNEIKLDFDYLPSGVPSKTEGRKLIFESGEEIVLLKNGGKIINAKSSTLFLFPNGDVQQKFPNGTTAYRYKANKTVEITTASNIAITKFENKQIEIRFPNGDIKVQFPNGTIRYIQKDGSMQTIALDGTITTANK